MDNMEIEQSISKEYEQDFAGLHRNTKNYKPSSSPEMIYDILNSLVSYNLTLPFYITQLEDIGQYFLQAFQQDTDQRHPSAFGEKEGLSDTLCNGKTNSCEQELLSRKAEKLEFSCTKEHKTEENIKRHRSVILNEHIDFKKCDIIPSNNEGARRKGPAACNASQVRKVNSQNSDSFGIDENRHSLTKNYVPRQTADHKVFENKNCTENSFSSHRPIDLKRIPSSDNASAEVKHFSVILTNEKKQRNENSPTSSNNKATSTVGSSLPRDGITDDMEWAKPNIRRKKQNDSRFDENPVLAFNCITDETVDSTSQSTIEWYPNRTSHPKICCSKETSPATALCYNSFVALEGLHSPAVISKTDFEADINAQEGKTFAKETAGRNRKTTEKEYTSKSPLSVCLLGSISRSFTENSDLPTKKRGGRRKIASVKDNATFLSNTEDPSKANDGFKKGDGLVHFVDENSSNDTNAISLCVPTKRNNKHNKSQLRGGSKNSDRNGDLFLADSDSVIQKKSAIRELPYETKNNKKEKPENTKSHTVEERKTLECEIVATEGKSKNITKSAAGRVEERNNTTEEQKVQQNNTVQTSGIIGLCLLDKTTHSLIANETQQVNVDPGEETRNREVPMPKSQDQLNVLNKTSCASTEVKNDTSAMKEGSNNGRKKTREENGIVSDKGWTSTKRGSDMQLNFTIISNTRSKPKEDPPKNQSKKYNQSPCTLSGKTEVCFPLTSTPRRQGEMVTLTTCAKNTNCETILLERNNKDNGCLGERSADAGKLFNANSCLSTSEDNSHSVAKECSSSLHNEDYRKGMKVKAKKGNVNRTLKRELSRKEGIVRLSRDGYPSLSDNTPRPDQNGSCTSSTVKYDKHTSKYTIKGKLKLEDNVREKNKENCIKIHNKVEVIIDIKDESSCEPSNANFKRNSTLSRDNLTSPVKKNGDKLGFLGIKKRLKGDTCSTLALGNSDCEGSLQERKFALMSERKQCTNIDNTCNNSNNDNKSQSKVRCVDAEIASDENMLGSSQSAMQGKQNGNIARRRKTNSNVAENKKMFQKENVSTAAESISLRLIGNGASYNAIMQNVQYSIRDSENPDKLSSPSKTSKGKIQNSYAIGMVKGQNSAHLHLVSCMNENSQETDKLLGNGSAVDCIEGRSAIQQEIDPRTGVKVSSSVLYSNNSTNDLTKDTSRGYLQELQENDSLNEDMDINDPAWEVVRKLKTDEERYFVVKNCWGSEHPPHPQNNLTYHSHRIRRVNSKELRPSHWPRKRAAALYPAETNPSKSTRTEVIPCTVLQDKKLEYLQEDRDSETLSNTMNWILQLRNITENYKARMANLQAIYDEKIQELQKEHISCHERASAEWNLGESLRNEMRQISQAADEARRMIRNSHRRKENVINSRYSDSIRKVKESKLEVFRFNQFYCGLHNTDPLILENKLAKEALMMEEMYRIYRKYYSGRKH